MGKKKKKEKKTERQAFGITVLKAADKRIRKLKKEHEPLIHGNKFWSSSWVIMDYLERQGLPRKARVMEVGCGWGLAGIYCAKNYGAKVTGLDADPQVFPYLDLHAKINDVEIKTVCSKFEDIKKKELAKQDILIGADICFWEEMTDPVYNMVRKAIQAGVQQVIIADPGRPPFDEMTNRCSAELGAEVKEWEVEDPVKATAFLMIAGSLPG
ncbi:MAG: methyltransferase domain-containing protein [Gemmatimonadetes bacterium]|jgi:predicted nicotinamide N-methyase|nr:methyltransferase domain-containing protein [Gemmatimonadota bacterium]